jgi:uncharacterized damage-inducible protein DinB
MSEITGIIDGLKRVHYGDAWHGPSLRETLGGVTAARAAAKPVPAAHSIWEIVLHIAAWNKVVARRLEGHRVNEPEEGDFPPVGGVSTDAWAQALAALDGAQEGLIKAVSGLSDARLQENVTGTDYTVGFMLRGVISHVVYHSGQIALLKKS